MTESPFMKFGKLPAKKDPRNLRMADILRVKKEPPEEYDFDVAHNGVPTPMFGNDAHGDCVIAGRAHQTLRFEVAEQNKILPITTDEVLTAWRKENGNTEDGLIMLDSLNAWRKDGWLIGGQNYKIKAFAEVNPIDHKEVKSTIFSDIGIMLGVSLPDSWIKEFYAGKPWADTNLPPNYQSGHCVYIPGYTHDGPVCVTWGRKQQMSWEWFDKYTDEAYAVLDATNIQNIDIGILLDFFYKLGRLAMQVVKTP